MNFLGCLLGGWVRVRMEDQKRERENRIGSASKVIIAVAVVASIAVTVGKFHIALILLLVDPLHNVLMAKP